MTRSACGALSELLARELELVEIGTRIQSQVQSEMDKGQREYWLRQQLKAIQEELGEVDEAAGRGQRAPRAARRGRACPSTPASRPSASCSASSACRRSRSSTGVIRTYLEWLATLPWSRVQRGHARPEGGAQAARPGPLRHREGEGPHPRVPRRAQAEAGRALLDPLLRRAARRREDLARAARSPARSGARSSASRVGGVRDESEIRGHRRTYIGAMPGHDHPRDARRRHEQPGPDDRRDRQDGHRLPRRSRRARCSRCSTPSRTRPSATTTSTCRSTSRTSCSSAPRTSSTRCRRPLRDRMEIDPALRLHGRGEARDREALPRAAPDGAQRRGPLEDRVHGSRRSTRSSRATRARPACATSSARSARCAARSRASSRRASAARSARSARRRSRELLGKPRFQPETGRRTGEPGVATGLAWTPVGGDVLFVEATVVPRRRASCRSPGSSAT